MAGMLPPCVPMRFSKPAPARTAPPLLPQAKHAPGGRTSCTASGWPAPGWPRSARARGGRIHACRMQHEPCGTGMLRAQHAPFWSHPRSSTLLKDPPHVRACAEAGAPIATAQHGMQASPWRRPPVSAHRRGAHACRTLQDQLGSREGRGERLVFHTNSLEMWTNARSTLTLRSSSSYQRTCPRPWHPHPRTPP
jgi:hypothetical protein